MTIRKFKPLPPASPKLFYGLILVVMALTAYHGLKTIFKVVEVPQGQFACSGVEVFEEGSHIFFKDTKVKVIDQMRVSKGHKEFDLWHNNRHFIIHTDYEIKYMIQHTGLLDFCVNGLDEWEKMIRYYFSDHMVRRGIRNTASSRMRQKELREWEDTVYLEGQTNKFDHTEVKIKFKIVRKK